MAPKQDEALQAPQVKPTAPQLKPQVQSFLAKAGREVDLANVRPERAKALEAAKSSGNVRRVQSAVMQIAKEDAPAVAARWQMEAAQKKGYKFTEQQKDQVMFHTKIIVDSPEKGLGAYKDALAEMRSMMRKQDAARAPAGAAFAKKPEAPKPETKAEAKPVKAAQETEKSRMFQKIWKGYAANKLMLDLQDKARARERELMSQHFPNGFSKDQKKMSAETDRFEAIKSQDQPLQSLLTRFKNADRVMTAALRTLDVSPEALFLAHGAYSKHAVTAILAPAVMAGLEGADTATAQYAKAMGGAQKMADIMRRDIREFEKVSGRTGETLADSFTNPETRDQWKALYKRYF